MPRRVDYSWRKCSRCKTVYTEPHEHFYGGGYKTLADGSRVMYLKPECKVCTSVIREKYYKDHLPKNRTERVAIRKKWREANQRNNSSKRWRIKRALEGITR